MASKKKREEVICFDSVTTVKSTTVFCPICGSTKEILYTSVPELKTIIVECCGKDKYKPL
jgi:hypothetical protein